MLRRRWRSVVFFGLKSIAEYSASSPSANVIGTMWGPPSRLTVAMRATIAASIRRRMSVASRNGMGIQLKGPLEGLIDFPSDRDGELVELCWKLGEEGVEHWHRVGEGFAGRKKL